MADAQADQDPFQAALLAGFDGLEHVEQALAGQVLGVVLLLALDAEAGDRAELVAAPGQRVDVGGVGDQAALDEQADQLFAEAVDVHRAAAGEMLEAALDDVGAGAVGAVGGGVVLAARDGAVADGAGLRELPGLGRVGAFAGHVGDDLRDHLAGAAHDDDVALADVLAVDVVEVVQRGALDGDAADADGGEHGVGVERAGAADADRDPFELGRGLLRGELPGDGPARFAADRAQVALQAQVVDLDDDAVDVEGERVASAGPALAGGGDGVDPVVPLGLRRRRQAQ